MRSFLLGEKNSFDGDKNEEKCVLETDLFSQNLLIVYVLFFFLKNILKVFF